MKTLIIALLLISSTAFAGTTIVTFSITSSASTATPNLRIAEMKPVLAQASGPIQGFAWDSTTNHYLTKSTALTYNTLNTKVVEIEASQNTKMYLNSDLTNYILLYADTPKTVIFR